MLCPWRCAQISSASYSWCTRSGSSGCTSLTSSILKTGFGKCSSGGATGSPGALYVAATGRRIVIRRVFRKKTQKTPRREIELARERAKEVT
jgi:Phage derived protein Gp49-like (DUF891)